MNFKKSSTECFVEMFGTNTMWRVRVFVTHKRVSEGQENVGDEERRPVTATTEVKVHKVNEIVRKDRRLNWEQELG